MSRFFEPVEFELSPDPSDSRPKTIVVWDGEQLKSAWKEILAELEKIKTGQSELYPRAMDPGKFGWPAENAMKIFIRDPSDKSFEGIHEICRQDFSARAGDHFYNLLKACRREEDNG